ncbi:hypothetical protein [Luteitalea sp.]
MASRDAAGLSGPTTDLVAEASIPASAAHAGWSWAIVVACETHGHHQHDYQYPFTVADGGEPGVVTRPHHR